MTLSKRLAILVMFCAACPGLVFGGTLAELPLSLRGSVPSNVLFDISVEWPTALTAAYNDVSGYTKATQYEGLFDPNLCYEYDNGLGRFVPDAAAANHVCTGKWSGNFLNWATMTGLDAFRYATTGGNRSTDTPTLTVLERTYISGQGNLFPNKTFNPTTTEFVGATPFSVNTTYTMVNFAKGIQMTLTGTETVTTTGPGPVNETISCNVAWSDSTTRCSQFVLGSTGATGTCASWTGSGSSGNPYRCTAFSSFSPLGQVPVLNNSNCDNIVRPNPSRPRICSTYDAHYTGTVTTTTTTNVNNTYDVRLEACKVSASFPLRDNCQQYGSTYKPVGEIQRNGEKMRFGVFSYYNSPDIDNAVMRSKLKYVAPNKYSSSAATAANPNKEWSQSDGTFIANPDPVEAANSWGGAVTNSGVINYLNKFGRQSGAYKTFDNFGKMYYESMRYLRKLPPTQAFYQYSSPANNDEFPVITDWYRDNDDPMQYTCQKNYIITMGDQFTHCDKRLPGGEIAPYHNATPGNPNRGRWCGSAAYGTNPANPHNVDDQNSLSNGDPLNLTTLTNAVGSMETPSRPTLGTERTGSGGNASFLAAGLAHWAATNDIRPDLDNTVPDKNGGSKPQTVKTFVIDVEENAALGVNTQFWYMAKYGGSDEYSSTGAPLNWSKDVNYTTSAASPPFVNSHVGPWPKSLLRAGNPASMIASIKEALATIEGEIGSSSALSQSQTDLRTGDGAFIYRAIFNSDSWSGDLQAYEVDRNGTLGTTPRWSAASQLTLRAPSSRVVFTFNDGLNPNGTPDTTPGNKNRQPVRFDPDNISPNLSPRQRDFLNHDSFGAADSLGVDRMRYLLGASTDEGSNGHKWRARVSKDGTTLVRNILGDIINSSPKYVSRPQFGLPGDGYNEFAQEVRDRTPMIYVGSNDGMLHGFEATKPGTVGATPGQELIAYVPSAVYSRLNYLMAPTYNHKYFVDGSPTVGEACFGSCAGKSNWKTILVGGLNAGGQGIYALDVTKPTGPSGFANATATDVVLWEFTDRDDPDLGYTFSKPVIQLMNNGKWAVIFGNGFNNTASDGKAGTGRAYLYILPVDGPGNGNAWVKDTNYYKIELKSGETASTTLPLDPPNGLASLAAIDRDLNDTADYVYAGDRYGNLWKIDVSDSNPSQWKPAFGTSSDPQPLFKATYPNTSGTQVPQTVTTGVTVSGHPNGGFMVLFGTGSFIEASDNLAPFKTDSYYGIWDKDNATTTSQGTTVTRDKLQQQKVVDTLSVGDNTYLFQSTCRPNYNETIEPSNANGTLCPADIAYTNSGQQLGWFFNLPDDGERTAAAYPVLDSSVLTFTTLTPSEDPCTGNTIGREYQLNYLTGGATPTSVFDLDGNGRIDAADLFNVPGLGSQGTGLAASGIKLKGGKSEVGASFQLPRTDTPNTTTHACPDFIPGWGCPSEMAPQRNCQKWSKNFKSQDSVSIASSAALGLSGAYECRVGKAGRFTWRQITK